jgi:hypothetical protein
MNPCQKLICNTVQNIIRSHYHSNIPDTAAKIATPFNMTLAGGAPSVEGVPLPVDDGSAVPVEELTVAVGMANVSEALVDSSPVAEGVAEDEVVVVNLIPQTFSGSKVNSMPLPSHPKLCRWMESRYCRPELAAVPPGR